jgi:hypothetical protein
MSGNDVLRGLTPTLRRLVIAGLALLVGAALYCLPTLSQDNAYHHFADQRTFFGIPHFANVVSNLPFVLVGALGIVVSLRGPVGETFAIDSEREPYLLLFLAIGLSGFGSMYYHLDPTNERLVWDRLPMAVAFMALFCTQLNERVSPYAGTYQLLLFVALGAASVIYWHRHDDLRPYYFVQFFPMLAMPVMLLFFPTCYTAATDLWAALMCYVLAKLTEHPLDGPIYALGGFVSGHTLKHLLAALGAWWLVRILRRRRVRGAPPTYLGGV